jgi:hypothetical protein
MAHTDHVPESQNTLRVQTPVVLTGVAAIEAGVGQVGRDAS